MATVFQGPASLFVPNHEATGKMMVEYVRKPESFAINRYCKFIPMPQPAGYWLAVNSQDAARAVNLNDVAWADGMDAPMGMQRDGFTWNPTYCKRAAYACPLGQLAVDNADFDLVAQTARFGLSRAMTYRSYRVATALQTSSNWGSANYGSAAGASGGLSGSGSGAWLASSVANQYIRKTLDFVRNQIILGTNGVAEVWDLSLVIDPNGAKIIAEANEIQQWLVNNPVAYSALNLTEKANWDEFGLPPAIYGFKTVVDKTNVVTSNKDATLASNFLYTAASGQKICAIVVARPGGLLGTYGVPEFSTCTVFSYAPDDMTIENMNDVNNRRVNVRVVDNYDVQVTAPATGFLITNINAS